MSLDLDRDFTPHAPPREISAEAASEFSRAPSYDDLWGRPERPVARALPEPRRDRWPVIMTIIAILIGATALIALRERVVRILPPAAHLYGAVGMPVNLAGLELRDVRSRIVLDGARRVLTVEGEIVNIRRQPNRVPSVALAVRGDNGLDRYSWTSAAPKAKLEPGEKVTFRARLASPPEDGADVLVRFAKLDETPARAPAAKKPLVAR